MIKMIEYNGSMNDFAIKCVDNVTGTIPHPLSYTELVNAYGNQMIDKFLIIGIVFLLYSYWNRCGMQRYKDAGESIPKIIMRAIFKDQAEEQTKIANEVLNGIVAMTAIISIAIWLMYKLGW